jgi:hypothetical protein
MVKVHIWRTLYDVNFNRLLSPAASNSAYELNKDSGTTNRRGSSSSSSVERVSKRLGFLEIDWGHVALEIPDDDPNCVIPKHYMSYWPPHKKAEKYSYDYDDDKETCGEAHCTIPIHHLSESAMAEAWECELSKPFDDLNHNCCTVTAILLREGYNASFTSEGFWISTGRIIKRSYRIARSPFNTFLTQARNSVADSTVWSPAKIQAFAKWLQQITA